MELLVVAPHHDDEIIGCGGLICHSVGQGYRVRAVHVFAGTSGVVGEADESTCQRTRTSEAALAARAAGYELLGSLGFRDRSHPSAALMQDALVQVFREYRPDVVLLPCQEEADLEHRAVGAAGREAAWLSASPLRYDLGLPVKTAPQVLHYEVWGTIARPAFYLDISDYVSRKRELLECYRSQMSSTGWLEGALGKNAWRGTTMQGRGYVEAFDAEPISLGSIRYE